MKQSEQKKAAKEFVKYWLDVERQEGKIAEDKYDQKFWNKLLSEIYGIQDITSYIDYQKRVVIDEHTKRIDGYIRAENANVLIEQKSSDISLDKGEKQSDGSFMTPFEQADRYAAKLDYDERPRWIIVSNFKEISIYDMNDINKKRRFEPSVVIKLEELPEKYGTLDFLKAPAQKLRLPEIPVSVKAGELIKKLYDKLITRYPNPEDAETLKTLNKLCVRIVFCLYAEDAGLFGNKQAFHDYLAGFNAANVNLGLEKLFKTLNSETRSLDSKLAEFPYVNGGLFAGDIEIPEFDEETVKLLLEECSERFDWSKIDPTIFGAIFESTLNPETRKIGGMHYTSIENIHKVIDPLFLDDLKKELAEIKEIIKTKKGELSDTLIQRLIKYQDKLAGLKFIDPACGSGNFLTETYLCLRELENEAIALKYKDSVGQVRVLTDQLIKVSINQFYGIEINDFAVSVAKTALWIAEAQMLEKTQSIAPDAKIEFLPLKNFDNIVEANANLIDWSDVVPKNELNYIISNPPFVGAMNMTSQQKQETNDIFKGIVKAGKLDYVACWYKKAADIMSGTDIRTALVSTNSITQGEQVSLLWKYLFENGVHIDFAHTTFVWESYANDPARVHCVIVGISKARNTKQKMLYISSNSTERPCKEINGYLVEGSTDIIIESRSKPLCNVPEMFFGSMPNDAKGKLSNYSEDDMKAIVNKYPIAEKMFRRIYGAEEYINNKARYCLWLKDIPVEDIIKVQPVLDAVNAVKAVRLTSGRDATKKLAETPMLFGEIRQPDGDYLLVPRVSSEHRCYIPIGFIAPDIIASDAVQIIPNAMLYHFGVLTSSVHMAWMRAVCGRLKSDYRYSKDIVYNNFPWPEAAEEQKAEIEKTAQGILDARAEHPMSSLAQMYGENMYLYTSLAAAHNANNKAVLKAYGLKNDISEEEIVKFLMKRYQVLTKTKTGL